MSARQPTVRHRFSASELAGLRRSALSLARSYPVGSDRNQHRQIALSLRALSRSEKWLELNAQQPSKEATMKRQGSRPDMHDWQARADDALELARAMPPGSERIEAFKKAGLLRNAAEAKAVFTPSLYGNSAATKPE